MDQLRRKAPFFGRETNIVIIIRLNMWNIGSIIALIEWCHTGEKRVAAG